MKVLVEADGGARGNPGPAGFGAVVRNASTGVVLAEVARGIGVATNNVAEYQGLIAGLEAAAEAGASTVDVRMDSKLVVEQMSGRWQVKHPSMLPLHARARALAAGFDEVTYEWVPRAKNTHADRLANEAMDAAVAAVPAAPGWTGAIGTPTRLLLLRHGQTELSGQHRYSGRGDPPLTELGRAQAAAAALRLADEAADAVIVSSPLSRSVQTATAVAEASGGRVVTHEGLVETDFGAWEGLTFAEAAERDPAVHSRWLRDPSVPAPDGESFDQVHRRVRAALNDLVDAHGGSTIVVVSHVTPIKSLLRLGLDVGPSLLFRLHVDLASLSIVEFYPDGNASVRLVNDTSYLPAAG